MSVWSFNKGEWTECYVFLRLLGQGRMYGATRELVKDPNVYVDIKEIYRWENNEILTFRRMLDSVSIVEEKTDTVVKVVTPDEMDSQAVYLYRVLTTKEEGFHETESVTKEKNSLSIPKSQAYMESLGLSTPKPSYPEEWENKYGKKVDIVIRYINSADPVVSTDGFSIKSHFGSNPTLFNCSQSSQFLYEVEGCTDDKMYRLNSDGKETDTIFRAIDMDPELNMKYLKCKSEIFEDNLALCDSRMAEVLNCISLQQIYKGKRGGSSCKTIVKEMAETNPLKVRNPKAFYETVIKRFLFNSFAGMTASTKWDGRRKLTGGYVDVNKDGEILYYRAVSDDVFESYLLEHTSWDRPSRGKNQEIQEIKGKMYVAGTPIEQVEACHPESTKAIKGDWGYIYRKDGKYYITLNFQIRIK